MWSQRFKYLQRIIYNTNLEVQGIHNVRWLSRGDAVKRLCKVLGAAIVLFHEKEHDLYEVVTSYNFLFFLFFLADILSDMNDLNCSFQKRQVDVTEVVKTADSVTNDLAHMYLDTKAVFGGTGNGRLPKFMTLYGKRAGHKVHVRCMDN
ncbi:unnamed protein product [Closterium sp. Naga37s-1]|nr:unnamed protein product [Closterium sp. Naga37s-1]